jgi:uncharacterized glyoxalase superfamily protein PhnB
MPDRALDELLNQAIDAVLAGRAFVPFSPDLEPLVRIASALRQMPAEEFQSRLRNELQRRVVMLSAAPAAVRPGFRTITPYVTVVEGARLIKFIQRTFGADETFRSPSPGGFHAEIRIGDSMLMIGSGESVRGRERISAFHVYVPDCDAAYRRALDAGATSLGEPADQPYGERSGFVKDFAGNHWYLATRFASVAAPEGVGSLLPFLFPGKARAFIDFTKRAFGAEEMGVFEESGRVMHAAVRIQDSVLEMGEPEGETPTFPARFFMYVDNCDRWYEQAVEAGAASIQEPADQPDGHRTAIVLDPFGYEWVPASLLNQPQGV